MPSYICQQKYRYLSLSSTPDVRYQVPGTRKGKAAGNVGLELVRLDKDKKEQQRTAYTQGKGKLL